jgi:hypothetical protein
VRETIRLDAIREERDQEGLEDWSGCDTGVQVKLVFVESWRTSFTLTIIIIIVTRPTASAFDFVSLSKKNIAYTTPGPRDLPYLDC